MRVMLIAFPTRTHIYSMAPVGWALRAAGHEVRYVGPRNPTEDDSFLQTGLDVQWVGDEVDIARQRKLETGPNAMDGDVKISETRQEKMTDEYIRTVYELWAGGVLRWSTPDSLLDELLAFARQWQPELVIWDPLMYAGPLVAHAIGAAHIRMLYAADQNARMDFQYRDLIARLADPTPDPLVEWMSDWLERNDSSFDDTLRLGMASIDPGPACIRYDLAVDYIPVQFVPVNRPLPIPRWVVEPPRRPRVVLTLGVSNRQVLGVEETSVGDLLTGLGELDIEVIATLNAGQLASVDRLPDNVRAVDFIPMNEVLASCSGIVHQGGGATIGNAVVNGVPQLIVPGTTWSERASALAQEDRGNGLTLDLEDVTRESVRDNVERLISEPSFGEAAAEVQQEMLDTRTLSDIVPDLEVIASRC